MAQRSLQAPPQSGPHGSLWNPRHSQPTALWGMEVCVSPLPPTVSTWSWGGLALRLRAAFQPEELTVDLGPLPLMIWMLGYWCEAPLYPKTTPRLSLFFPVSSGPSTEVVIAPS